MKNYKCTEDGIYVVDTIRDNIEFEYIGYYKIQNSVDLRVLELYGFIYNDNTGYYELIKDKSCLIKIGADRTLNSNDLVLKDSVDFLIDVIYELTMHHILEKIVVKDD